MSSPKSTLSNRSHRHSGSASPTTSPRSRSSSSSSSSKRKSEVFCSVCLKETIPMLSRSTLFSIQNYCSMVCYSKSINEVNSIETSTPKSNESNTTKINESSSSSASTTTTTSAALSNNNLSTNVTSESSFRKFNYNSNSINFIQV